MFLLRVQLPDQPGGLAQVATAISSVGADILSIEIVDRAPDGHVIDDFLLELPPGQLPEELVVACQQLDGVQVLWLSRYSDRRSIESDLEIAHDIGQDRSRAAELLLEHLPRAFHSKWAAVINLPDRRVLVRTEFAPDLTPAQIDALEPFDSAHFTEMSEAWVPGWGTMSLAVVPSGDGLLLIVARGGGPDFLDSELHRLYHLIRLAR